MTTTQAITVFGIVLAAIVALSVGYLQRKQARQIELYRQDPSVGLTPPPSTVTKFVKTWWASLVFGIVVPLIALGSTLRSDEAVTGVTILVISTNIAVIVFNVIMLLMYNYLNRVYHMVELLAEAAKRHVEVTGKIAEVVTSTTGQSRSAGT